MLQRPTKSATKASCGSSYSSLGETDLPDPMTTRRSAVVSASSWVVRHQQCRQAETLLQGAHFKPNLGTQLGVEIGEGFIEQEELWIDHRRACQRDALLLPAGQFARQAVRQSGKPGAFHRFFDADAAFHAAEPASQAQMRHFGRQLCEGTGLV
jgi:hypothetical protein